MSNENQTPDIEFGDVKNVNKGVVQPSSETASAIATLLPPASSTSRAEALKESAHSVGLPSLGDGSVAPQAPSAAPASAPKAPKATAPKTKAPVAVAPAQAAPVITAEAVENVAHTAGAGASAFAGTAAQEIERETLRAAEGSYLSRGFKSIGNGFRSVGNGIGSTFKSGANAVGGAFKGGFNLARGGVNMVGSGAKWSWNNTSTSAKVVAAVGLAVGTLFTVAHYSRKRAKVTQEKLNNADRAMEDAALAQMEAQNTLMGEQLVLDGPHGTRVQVGRGQVPNQAVGAAQPPVPAVDGKPIEDLGAPAR